MSLESLNMAGGVLGTAFSLLLLASITQGLQDVDILHYEKMEAVVGENVTLPCIIQGSPSLTIVSVEWRKNKSGNTKLAVPTYGLRQFWPNVIMQMVPSGSYLHLHDVETWDSGFYICDITTFLLGTIRSETELKIKDEVKILCDAESIVEVPPGENVTISCTAFPADHYKWTKNNTLVSEIQSLELWLVTEAHSGIYTLTVNTGNKSVHKEFSITVLTATTSLRTGSSTMTMNIIRMTVLVLILIPVFLLSLWMRKKKALSSTTEAHEPVEIEMNSIHDYENIEDTEVQEDMV